MSRGVMRVGLMVVALVLTSCSGGGDGKVGARGTPTPSRAAESILIKTRVTIPTGKVLEGSTVGNGPFCPSGTLADQHGTADIGLVDRTFTCPDGTLRIGFDPQTPVGDTQSGPWRIISGTGAYAGWSGGGQMLLKYDPTDKDPHPTHGEEKYTGTVSR